ncbi:hypothetical protein LZ31DRAFT_382587 [Colletotrichum somersetense]|nr:hypothetical protein LZ31DRAFT_382587 [Colletotrichum somersetense]
MYRPPPLLRKCQLPACVTPFILSVLPQATESPIHQLITRFLQSNLPRNPPKPLLLDGLSVPVCFSCYPSSKGPEAGRPSKLTRTAQTMPSDASRMPHPPPIIPPLSSHLLVGGYPPLIELVYALEGKGRPSRS